MRQASRAERPCSTAPVRHTSAPLLEAIRPPEERSRGDRTDVLYFRKPAERDGEEGAVQSGHAKRNVFKVHTQVHLRRLYIGLGFNHAQRTTHKEETSKQQHHKRRGRRGDSDLRSPEEYRFTGVLVSSGAGLVSSRSALRSTQKTPAHTQERNNGHEGPPPERARERGRGSTYTSVAAPRYAMQRPPQSTRGASWEFRLSVDFVIAWIITCTRNG